MSKDNSCILKGICAGGVLFNHLLYWAGMLGNISLLANRISNVSMAGFLFVSGYGCFISWENNGLVNFWEKKIDRLLIPILCSNILGYIFELGFMGHTYSRREFWDGLIARKVYYPTFNGALWYVHFLVLWYAVFYLIYRYVNKEFFRLLLWAMFSCVIFYITPEVYALANLYGLAFPLGVAYAKQNPACSKAFRFLLGIVSFVVLLYVCDDAQMSICGMHLNFFVYAIITNILYVVTFFALIAFAECINTSRSKRLFLWIGKLSFGIYIYQTPILQNLLMNMNLKINKIIVMILGIIICLLFAYGTEKLVSQLNKRKAV